jgi:hypothetical protein
MEKLIANPVQFWAESHAWIIGFILISLSSYTRFNIPPTSRSSTTWGRYYTAAVMYMGVTITGWLMLANTPDILAYLGNQAKVEPSVTQLAAPLYAALVLTVLVSSLKPFQKADERLRTFLQDLARIPWEAKRLSATLRATPWLPTADLQDQVHTALKEEGFKEYDISLADDQSPQALWTKIAALHYHVARWQSGEPRRFVAFYYQHLTDFQTLFEDYKTIAAMARRVFPLLDTLQPVRGDSKLATVQQELIDEFVTQATRLEKDICDLVSRALLRCTLTERTRWEACEAMGFVVNVAPDRLCDRLLLLHLMIGGWYIGLLSVAHRPRPILTGTMISTVYVGAILSALYPKRWPWARPNEAGRSIRGYVFSGLLGFVFSLVSSASLGVFLTGDVKIAGHLLFERGWPWSFIAALTAAATAYNVDNDGQAGRRWVEATLQAAVSGVGGLIVYYQLHKICDGIATPDCVPPFARVILSAAVSGGIIGWLVPTWYREPQTITVDYKECKVIAALKVLPTGDVAPTIRVIQHHGADVQATALPFERTFLSTEEALAKAIESAREYIDADLATAGVE